MLMIFLYAIQSGEIDPVLAGNGLIICQQVLRGIAIGWHIIDAGSIAFTGTEEAGIALRVCPFELVVLFRRVAQSKIESVLQPRYELILRIQAVERAKALSHTHPIIVIVFYIQWIVLLVVRRIARG